MSWNEQRLTATLAQLRRFGDDTTLVECKRAAGGLPESLGITICAFANMPQAGVILLGVDERQDFAVVGVARPAQLEKQVAHLSRTAVTPTPQLEFSHLNIDGRAVLVVEVMPLLPQEKPATVKHRAYLRQADGDYEMNSNDLRMLGIAALTENQQPQFDFTVLPGTDTAILDQEVLSGYLKNVRDSRSRLSSIDDDQRLLQMANVTDAQGQVRRAGLYALGYLPQSQEPALGATVAVRLARETGSGRTKNLTEIEGPIPVMLSQARQWIQQNTTVVSRYNLQGDLVDTPEFPPQAIREVVANALVHRDLGPSLETGKKVEIRITDKALVVANPGGLRGISVDQLNSSSLSKAAVNKRLYEIARYLQTADGARVIEGEGGGIQEILTALREARLPKPLFIDTGVEFKVVFPRGSRFTPEEDAWLATLETDGVALTPTEEDLLINMRSHGPVTLSRVVNLYAPLSGQHCRSMLDRLVAAGALEERGGVYHLRETTNLQTAAAATPPAAISVPAEIARLGKNVPRVYAVLLAEVETGHVTLRQIIEATGLSDGQVRYALEPMLRDGIVVMNGGQGSRATTYSLT